MKSLLKILPLFTILFFSCQKEYETLGPKEELLQQIAQLNQEIEAFEQMAQKNASNKQLQQSFEISRLAYKKIEWAVEYFTPEPARFINGPALDELEVEENKFLNPSGFQVIEELIYPTFSTKEKATLQREIAVLKGLIMQVKEHVSVITISPDYVVDAVKMQMYRIITLGITGFDSPIANNSIPEAQASLLALPSLIEKLHQEPSQIQNSLLERIRKAATFCNNAKDFNSFDRALFIKNYLNPISKSLQEFQQHHKIANVTKTNAVLQRASSLFGSKVFNVDAFIPSQEYAYTSAKAQLGKELF